MKTISTLLVGALFSVSAFASDVTVTLSNNNKYQVMIDGRNLASNGYSNNSNTYYLRNLSNGQHNIQVVRYRGNNNNNGRWNNNSNDVVYSNSFSVDPQYDLSIQVDNKGRVTMDQRRNNYNNGWNNNGRDRRDRDDDRYDNRNGNWNNGRNGNYGNNGSYGNNGGYNGYRTAMSDNDFNQLVQHIRSQWIGKFNTAKQSVSTTSNYFSTYQVRQILQIFSSESERLELAKLAYRNTVDPNNYRQVYDLFSSNGQADLDNYIRSFRY